MLRPAWIERLGDALPTTPWRTRFAPAPTGKLHLGHLVNAIHVWGIARAFGGRVLLRIEDHDRMRSRAEYERGILDDLEWLGLDADIGATATYRAAGTHALRQSDNDARYAVALSQLEQRLLVYPCTCSRRDIASLATAADGDTDERRYPGTCREATTEHARTMARRVMLAEHTERFDDLRLGPQRQTPSAQSGDVLARDRHGNWTYQFAVTVDDAAQQIDVVIRGEDLLSSTGRQLALARLIGRTSPPRFLHHALVRRADGLKLSKANRDTALREWRAQGLTPQTLLGDAARLAGLQPRERSLGADALPDLFLQRSR